MNIYSARRPRLNYEITEAKVHAPTHQYTSCVAPIAKPAA